MPSKVLPYKSGDYAANCLIAKPHLPKGYVFLKLGDLIPEHAECIGWDGEIMWSDSVGTKVCDVDVPIFVPVPAWRTDPLEVTRSILPVEELRRETVDGIIADFIKTVSDEKTFRAYLRKAKKGLTEADFD